MHYFLLLFSFPDQINLPSAMLYLFTELPSIVIQFFFSLALSFLSFLEDSKTGAEGSLWVGRNCGVGKSSSV